MGLSLYGSRIRTTIISQTDHEYSTKQFSDDPTFAAHFHTFVELTSYARPNEKSHDGNGIYAKKQLKCNKYQGYHSIGRDFRYSMTIITQHYDEEVKV